ncbi:hypothetical protein TRVL_06162 [Trypanosoma vivax]|nr:hypothetical protein TRVL_06162 [Trypanosoma vivax]
MSARRCKAHKLCDTEQLLVPSAAAVEMPPRWSGRSSSFHEAIARRPVRASQVDSLRRENRVTRHAQKDARQWPREHKYTQLPRMPCATAWLGKGVVDGTAKAKR